MTLQDMNGMPIYPGAKVLTKKGKEAYVISLLRNGKARIQFPGRLIRRVSADTLTRL